MDILTKLRSLNNSELKEIYQDRFLIEDSSLLLKQHKLYPHLVPAYRTVHRKVPRAITFRAIRWVNPRRQFKLMSVNPESYKNMGNDELKRHIIGLNKYREEALLISNRK